MASSSGEKNDILKERFQTMLQTVETPLTTECCIFRVPKVLRKMKASAAYTPSLISIGPFHHKSDELKYMEEDKVRYVNQALSVHKVNFDDLLSMVKDLEKRIRICYEEKIDLCSDDFVMMVVLDGVFIVEYLRQYCYLRDQMNMYGKMVLYAPKVEFSIRNDLILLENQLPFFVLDQIYNLVYKSYSKQPSFLQISCNFFSNSQKQEIWPRSEVLHFTDLIRKLHLPPIMEPTDHSVRNDDVKKHISSYSAKKLAESGINFRTALNNCLLDIKLTVTNGVFLIPPLTVDDNTESMFRNMMALEQYVYADKMYICDYVMLMDTLIDTSTDVELLARKHIMVNRLGDNEEVAALFNNLNRGILYPPGRYYFDSIRENLDDCCKMPTYRRIANVVRENLSYPYPWMLLYAFAGVPLLLLTFIQAVCSILQVLQ